jgi:hypothetical protein
LGTSSPKIIDTEVAISRASISASGLIQSRAPGPR